MTRHLVFGDIHLIPQSEFSSQTEDGFTTYLQECDQTFEWLAGLVRQAEPDFVIFLGDAFEQTGIVDTRSQVIASRGFLKITAACRGLKHPVMQHAIVGNHDLFDAHHAIHALEWLKADWTVHEKPEEDQGFIFIPWTQDQAAIEEVLSKSQAKTVFSHIEIEGSVRYAQGDDKEDRGVHPRIFNGRYVFNGHYHSPSDVSPGFSPIGGDSYYICNVGSPHWRTFSDAGSRPRGAMIIEVDDRKGVVSAYHHELNKQTPPFVDVTVTPDLDIVDPDVKTWNARIFYPAELEAQAQALAARCHASRMVPIGGAEIVLREEELTPQKTPLANLQEYLELQLPGIEDPAQYMSLDDYARDLVAKVPLDRYSQPVEFIDITIRNFCSIKEETYTYAPGVTLIEGCNDDDPTAVSNGSGKTALIVEALYWVLTNKVIRPDMMVDDVVLEGETVASVRIRFKVGADLFTLERTRETSGRGAGTRITLLQNGSPVDLRKGRDTEARLQEELHFSPARLFQVVLLTADAKTEYSQLGPTARIQMVEDMAGARVYDDLREIAKKDLGAREKTYRGLESSVSTVRTQVLQVTAEIGRLTDALAQSEARVAQDLSVLQEERTALETKLTQARQEYQAAQDQVAKSELDLAGYEKAAQAAQGQINGVRTRLSETESDLSKCRVKKGKDEATLTARQKEYDALSAAPANVCPLCNQPTQVDYRQGKLAVINRDIKALKDEIADGEGVVSRVELDVQKVKALLTQMEEESRSVLTERGRLQTELASARAAVTTVERVGRELKERLRVNLQAEERTRKQSDQFKQALAGATAEREAMVAQETVLTDQLTEAQTAVGTAQWWFTALAPAGLRSFIVERSLQYINHRLQYYSPRILGPKLGIVSLVSFRETTTGGISNGINIQLSGGRSFGKLSSGQRRRGNLAIKFAFRDLAESTSAGANLLICDEILDPIDGRGCRAVGELLTEMRNVSVFLTTHNPDLKALQFREKWLVRLRDNVSRVERT